MAKKDEIDNAKARIERSIEYMRRVWKEEEFERVRHKCKNQHPDCTYWASLGECEANAKYMVTNCAPACESCDQLDIRHRCPIEPGNECIWKPGDLDALMEDIVDDAGGTGEYEKYSPIALSRPKVKGDGSPAPMDGAKHGPWVVLLDNFVLPEEVDRIVEIGKNRDTSAAPTWARKSPTARTIPS